MKKILFLGGMNSGGSEHQMVVLATLLKNEGYDVTFLTDNKSSFFQNDLEKARVPILRISNSKLANLLKLSIPRKVCEIYSIIKKNKYDTVISFLGDWNFTNCITAKCKKTSHRAITGIRNNRDEIFLWRRERFYNKFERNTYLKVSNSEAAKNKFAKYYPSLSSKLATIYNAVDLPSVSTEYISKKDGRVNIIVPASYREVKNPLNVLNALALMSYEERSNVKIDWFGNIKGGQKCYNEMIAFIQDNDLNEVITLNDATTDIANKVNEADVIGLFSSSEGLPNSICEGMMLGKPVVMTRVSDYDVLVDQTNGFLCDWNNPQSIKDALIRASRLSVDELMRMGQCSKNKAESLFSKEVVVEQWKQII